MRSLILCSAMFYLSACSSFVEIRDTAKLSQDEIQSINELPIYDQRDVQRGTYKNLGDIEGYSCKNKFWDKPATKSAAMKQLKLKAAEVGGNAIILDSCYGEGTTYSKNCWEAYIPNVTPAYADAAGIKRYFTEGLGVKEGNVIFLKDATSAQLVGVFGNKENHKGKLFNWVKPNISNVYVYYAGHGAPATIDGSAFMVPSDASSETIELTGYPLSTLYKNLGKIPAKSITVLLEACFSGTSQGGTLISNASPINIRAKIPEIPSNITVISAGAANQMASWEKDKSHSLFTKYFLKGMSGEADAKPYGNGDAKVDYAELKKYMDGTMTYLARRYYGRDQKVQIVVGQSR